MKLRLILVLLILSSFVKAELSHTLHAKLAKEHVMITFKATLPKELAESVTNGLLMRHPTQRPFKGVYVDFFVKIFTSEEYIDGLVKIYMKHYTIKELAYVNKVYDDPKMISYLKKQPKAFQEIMVFGQEIGAKYQNELQEALSKKAKELETASK